MADGASLNARLAQTVVLVHSSSINVFLRCRVGGRHNRCQWSGTINEFVIVGNEDTGVVDKSNRLGHLSNVCVHIVRSLALFSVTAANHSENHS